MSVFNSFRRPIDYTASTRAMQEGYARLSAARQKKLDAEVQAAWRKWEEEQSTASDEQELAAIGIQLTAAYLSGGSSLAYAPQINQMYYSAIGKPKAATSSKSGQLSNLAQVGHGVYRANQAEKLERLDTEHERNMALEEQEYKQLMANPAMQEEAMAKAQDMKRMEQHYQQERRELGTSWGDKAFGGWWGYGGDDPSKSEGILKYPTSNWTVENQEKAKAMQNAPLTGSFMSGSGASRPDPNAFKKPAVANKAQQNIMATTEQKPDELNMQLGIKPKPQIDANTLQKNEDLGAQVFSQNQEKNATRIANRQNLNLQSMDDEIATKTNSLLANNQALSNPAMAELIKKNPQLLQLLLEQQSKGATQ